jgi:hypothetical protein
MPSMQNAVSNHEYRNLPITVLGFRGPLGGDVIGLKSKAGFDDKRQRMN